MLEPVGFIVCTTIIWTRYYVNKLFSISIYTYIYIYIYAPTYILGESLISFHCWVQESNDQLNLGFTRVKFVFKPFCTKYDITDQLLTEYSRNNYFYSLLKLVVRSAKKLCYFSVTNERWLQILKLHVYTHTHTHTDMYTHTQLNREREREKDWDMYSWLISFCYFHT